MLNILNKLNKKIIQIIYLIIALKLIVEKDSQDVFDKEKN